jgi:hypothetical protein
MQVAHALDGPFIARACRLHWGGSSWVPQPSGPVFGSFGNTDDLPPPFGHIELEEFNSPPVVESADTGPHTGRICVALPQQVHGVDRGERHDERLVKTPAIPENGSRIVKTIPPLSSTRAPSVRYGTDTV